MTRARRRRGCRYAGTGRPPAGDAGQDVIRKCRRQASAPTRTRLHEICDDGSVSQFGIPPKCRAPAQGGLFKKGEEPHVNNVELGRKGRWRSNLWTYPGASSLGSDARRGLKDDPTVKPVAMLEDALRDPILRIGASLLRDVVAQARLHCVAVLARLFGDRVMCVADAQAPGRRVYTSYERGRPRPLTRVAASKAILAQLPSRRLTRILDANVGGGEGSKGAAEGTMLRDELALIRCRGYVVTVARWTREW